MKIIILGAGQVGGTLTEHLADEQNDVTVVDSSDGALRQLQERLDIRTVKVTRRNRQPSRRPVLKMQTC